VLPDLSPLATRHRRTSSPRRWGRAVRTATAGSFPTIMGGESTPVTLQIDAGFDRVRFIETARLCLPKT